MGNIGMTRTIALYLAASFIVLAAWLAALASADRAFRAECLDAGGAIINEVCQYPEFRQ